MAPLNRKVLLNIPNLLTFGRIAVIPVIITLMLLTGPQNSFDKNWNLKFVTALLFIAAALSDLIDGYFARKLGMVSLLGRFADPMADKLIHMAVMVMLIPVGRIPAWFVVLLLFREISINGLRAVAAGEGIIISAGEWGKKKTAWMNVGLSSLLLPDPFFGVSSYTVGWFCLIVGTYYNIISGVRYAYGFFRESSKT